jgi:asparagine synthase (glutamine-hydrolysing)
MCGIAGAIGGRGGAQHVEAQLDLLEHRGPDSRGVFVSGAGAIGQTRLAVIDLETGDPPVTNEDRSVGVALNGEVYNFAALRQQLAQRGHCLRTRGDTEVIAHLAEELSPFELAASLQGMFAFAVWDGRRLVLGRDRLGKKPLYYWTRAGTLVFASEIKAVLAHPLVPREPEAGALDAYLTFGYVPSPRSFFAGVCSLPPGHVGVFEPGDGELRLIRYWDLPPPPARPAWGRPVRLAGAARTLRQLVSKAVERRMVADVPMGAFLSGGVDSSAVVATMAELSPRPVATFTIGFEDHDGYDERPFARAVARRFRTDHTEFVVRPDAAGLLEELVEHHDQPFGDSSALPTYLLAKLTRGAVTVALCGDGGDEVFAGYDRFAGALALARLRSLPSFAFGALGVAARCLPGSVLGARRVRLQRFLRRKDLSPHRALLSWVSYVPEEWRQRLLVDASFWGYEDYDRLWEQTAGRDLLGRLQALTIRSYLLDDLLVKVDRMTMAHGLEVRSPLLDPEVVAFGLGLPARAKVRGLAVKRVLKAAMADTLPAEVLRRRKHGFGLPLDRWFRSELRPWVEGTLGAPSARVRGHLDPTALDALLAEHGSGRADHGHAIFTLMSLEAFLRKENW